MTITVVVPTVGGREEHYERCVEAYQSRSVLDVRVVTVRDAPTCGVAWNDGARHVSGGFLHFTADDLEPLPGWDVAAVAACDLGFYPAARVDDPDGSTRWWGSEALPVADGAWVRAGWVPFMPAHWWPAVGPSLPIHYCTDDWLALKARRAGHPSVFVDRFAFVHHTAQPGRGAGMSERERRTADARVFDQAVRDLEGR